MKIPHDAAKKIRVEETAVSKEKNFNPTKKHTSSTNIYSQMKKIAKPSYTFPKEEK